MKPIVKHILSKELQLYYEKVTATIKSKQEEKVKAVLESIINDAGIHALVPYFAQFVSDEVTHNLKDLQLLTYLMYLIRAMLDSVHLHIEPYLHQLMPSILTCLVGKRLCETPEENHWLLRDYAAELVAIVCQRYRDAYKSLQPRVTKTLLQAFMDPTKPLTTHYGAIKGLAALGINVVELLLLPNVASYMKVLEPELQSTNPIKQAEAKKML